MPSSDFSVEFDLFTEASLAIWFKKTVWKCYEIQAQVTMSNASQCW